MQTRVQGNYRRVRAYALKYEVSAAINLPRLTAFQQWGTDSVVELDGSTWTVTVPGSGQPLKYTFAYTDNALSFNNVDAGPGGDADASPPKIGFSLNANDNDSLRDVARAEITSTPNLTPPNTVQCKLDVKVKKLTISTGNYSFVNDSGASFDDTETYYLQCLGVGTLASADFNGDGKDEILRFYNRQISQGTPPQPQTVPALKFYGGSFDVDPVPMKFVIADFDGDGLKDALFGDDDSLQSSEYRHQGTDLQTQATRTARLPEPAERMQIWLAPNRRL